MKESSIRFHDWAEAQIFHFLIGEYLLLTESRKYQLPGLLPVFRGLTYLSS